MHSTPGWFRGAALLASLTLGVMSLGCSESGNGQGARVERSTDRQASPRRAETPPAVPRRAPASESAMHPEKPAPPAPEAPSEPLIPNTAKKLGPHVYFERIAEGDQRRVYVETSVCLREGEYGLEFLLCRNASKEHESVLHTEADARIIHAGLQAAGAVAGSPVQFDPVFKSATGTPIKVSARYAEKGKIVTRPAQDWVRDVKTKKALAENWVFAGSVFYTDPDDPKGKPVYLAAQEGSYISVANVPTAMLDLPIRSPTDLEGRSFAPFTERIPPVDTKVVLILEPMRQGKKK